ncbi:MAG TPA: hypothetical protein ENJ42_08315 [Hellea balneolensis]|uniref:Uncharacterized protein n=1 Tax=Hellea balneolensis TaxID=287478 RepID=A0A7C5R4T2_9PROT|nr:hypothetical protein [Hellea balneolensis]
MTVFWQGISFVWAIIGVAVIAAIYGVRAWLGYRRLERDADEDWEYRASEGMTDRNTTKEEYISAFKRVHAPRAQLYMAMGLVSILLLTIPAFGLINYALYWVWRLSGENRAFEPGYLVWQFSIFFFIILLWALIGAFFARAYHRKAPGSMRDELLKQRPEYKD